MIDPDCWHYLSKTCDHCRRLQIASCLAMLELGLRWLHDRAEEDADDEGMDGMFVAGLLAGMVGGYVVRASEQRKPTLLERSVGLVELARLLNDAADASAARHEAFRQGSAAWNVNPGWRPPDGGDITAGSIRALLLRRLGTHAA